MTEMVHGTVFDHSVEPVLTRWWRTLDHWSVIAILALFAIGLLLGFAASPPLAEKNGQVPFFYVNRQAVFGLVALVAMMVISMMPPDTARRIGIVVFVVSLIGLFLLPIFGTNFGKGATRWFSFGFGSIQPSEFLKPGFIVFSAWLISGSIRNGGNYGKLVTFGLTTVIAALLAFQPDFGQASLVVFSWCMIYFISGASIIPLIGLAAIILLAGVVAYQFSDHFQGRINEFLTATPEKYSQLDLAMDAIRGGGLFGTGVGKGSIKWWLPDGHTDFIVAVAAEEFGLGLVLFLILLFAFICVRSLSRLLREQDVFIRLAGTGLSALFGVQAFINLGVSVRLLPAKGMTLPFVSYGGSSMIAIGIGLGILLAFTRSRPESGIQALFGNSKWR